jgi:hypothetical protein
MVGQFNRLSERNFGVVLIEIPFGRRPLPGILENSRYRPRIGVLISGGCALAQFQPPRGDFGRENTVQGPEFPGRHRGGIIITQLPEFLVFTGGTLGR